MPNQISPTARRCSFIIEKSAYALVEQKAKEKRSSVGHLIRTALETVYPEMLDLEPVEVTGPTLSREEAEKLTLIREALNSLPLKSLLNALHRGNETLPHQP